MEVVRERYREDFPEGRWLTYAELAAIRGIGRESAVKLAQRERWRKLPGNGRDRTIRILVPAEWLKAARQTPSPEALPEAIPELSRVAGALEAALAAFREQTEAANDRAAAAEARADRAEAGRDGERARADALRARLDGLQGELAEAGVAAEQTGLDLRVARHDAEAAQQGAAALRRAEVERKARGLLARLRAAWRGE
jgi:hypothetical protein